MKRRIQLVKLLIIFAVFVLGGGTLGYYLIEDGWSWLDALYMTIITVTTIGYHEVHALSDAGRMFTILLVVFGIGTAATFVSRFAQLLIEGSVRDMWRKRRMEKMMASLKQHVIVCGFGRIGRAICQELQAMGVTCSVIEQDEELLALAERSGFPAMVGNATSDLVLLSAGIKRAQAVVAALSGDSDNLFVALAARDLNPDIFVIARGEDKAIETRMLRAGVDRVVFPAQLGGGQIARIVGEETGTLPAEGRSRRATDVMGFDLSVYRNFNEAPMTVGSIKEATGAMHAVAFVRIDGQKMASPTDDKAVAEGEAVVLVGQVLHGKKERRSPGNAASGWHEGLSVGIAALDEEHQMLLELIQKLSSTDTRRRHVAVADVLTELRDLAERHFGHEEQLFAAHEYPDAQAHTKEHKKLLAKVEALVVDSETVHRSHLSDVLSNWIHHHILEMDRKYAEFLRERGVR